MSQMAPSNGAVANAAMPKQMADDPFGGAEIRSSAPGLERPLAMGEGKINVAGKDEPFKFEFKKAVDDITHLVVDAASETAKFFSSVGLAIGALVKNPKLAVAAAGVTFLGAEYSAKGVIIPDGWSDSQYRAAGEQCQTNLLSLRVYGTDPDTGQIRYVLNASATYLNSRFALAAAHTLEAFPLGSQLTAEVATGSNTQTNRGTVVPVQKILVHPDRIRDNSNTPDIAVLCLSSNLAGPSVTIASAGDGQVVRHAGFGDSGSPSTPIQYDKNSRAWDAPTDGFLPLGYTANFYKSTKFYPYITLNGRGHARDSGGPVMNRDDQNSIVGINIASTPGVTSSGYTVFLDLSNPSIRTWVDETTSRSFSLKIDSNKILRLSGNTNFLYGIEASINFKDWAEIGVVTNLTGTVNFQDPAAETMGFRMYRAVEK